MKICENQVKSKIWPQRLQKQTLDLKDLGRGSVNFPKSTFFKSGKRTDKNKLQVGLLVKLLRLPVFNCIRIAGPLGQTRSAITNLFVEFESNYLYFPKNMSPSLNIYLHCKCLQRFTGSLRGNQSAGISNLWDLHVYPQSL